MLVCPSILAADQLQLLQEIKSAEDAGADWLHVDVMDGHYVPNLTFGLPLIQALKKHTKLPLDVHLMITNPDDTAKRYIDAGADCLSFHIEVARHSHRLLQEIRSAGIVAGVAINPGTPRELLYPILDSLDFINVMSVNPGFYGQEFISSSVRRVESLRKAIALAGLEKKIIIQVDGGINENNCRLLRGAGAGAVVVGKYFYAATDRRLAVEKLKSR